MLPPFNDSGLLPPGIHPATMDEIDMRFGRQTELCRVQMESVRWLVNLILRAGAQRLVLDGSFVTDIMEPNDVDCVVLIGSGFPKDPAAEAEIRAGLPFLEISLVQRGQFDRLVGFFGTDRHNAPKGMVEVIL